MKEKSNIWKWILGILFLPFVPLYFIIKSTKLKTIYKVGLCVAYFLVIAVIANIARGTKIESFSISNVTLNKGEKTELQLKVTPKNASSKSIVCKIKDTSIAELEEMHITGINEGETEITCHDSYNSDLKKAAKINVNLTAEQIAQKKSEEETEKQHKANSLTDSEKIRLRDYAKKIINSALKAPSTADYPDSFLNPLNDWQMSKTNNLVTIVSYVDSQTSFVAMIRSEFIIQVHMNEDGSGDATYVELDGTVLKGTYQN